MRRTCDKRVDTPGGLECGYLARNGLKRLQNVAHR